MMNRIQFGKFIKIEGPRRENLATTRALYQKALKKYGQDGIEATTTPPFEIVDESDRQTIVTTIMATHPKDVAIFQNEAEKLAENYTEADLDSPDAIWDFRMRLMARLMNKVTCTMSAGESVEGIEV